MTIITKLDKHITTNVPNLESIDCYKLDSKNIVTFMKFEDTPYYAYTQVKFDVAIKNNKVIANEAWTKTVDPNGFIFNDEIYKIQIGE